jgi:GT2 family glycosyltransferase
MKISVVIPSYNGQELLATNLPKVISALEYTKEQKKIDSEIIVVNDGSSDETLSFMEDFIKSHKDTEIILKDNKKNLGFSPTVNNGVREASGEIIVLLNTDVTPDKDFILPLLSYFEIDTTFAVGCMDKSVEKGNVVLRGRGVGKWKEGYLKHSLGDLDKNDTLWVSGGSGAFRKSLWDKLGGLCELYKPYYWEDIDLSYRALKAGYTIYFEKNSTVVHKHEEGSIKKTQSSKKVLEIVNRNQNIFTFLNATDPSILLSFFLYLPIHIVRAIKNKEWLYLTGLIKALLMLPQIISFRSKYQKLVKVSDYEVITKIQA